MVLWDSPNHELLVLPFRIHHALCTSELPPNFPLVVSALADFRAGGHQGTGLDQDLANQAWDQAEARPPSLFYLILLFLFFLHIVFFVSFTQL